MIMPWPRQDSLNLLLWAFEAFPLALWAAWRSLGSPSPAAPRRILFLGYAAIGDTLYLLPVLEAVRKAYPLAHITFLANQNAVTRDLIPATGLVDDIELVEWWEGQSWAQRRAVTARLEARGYDAVILSHATPAHFFQRVIAGVPLRAGHCFALAPPRAMGPVSAFFWRLRRGFVTGELSRRLLLNRKAWAAGGAEHALRRNLGLLGALGIQIPEPLPKPSLPISEGARRLAEEALPAPGGRKVVGIHLGIASNPYFKIWSAQRFGRLCRRLEETGKAQCVLIGGPEEAESVAAARQAAGRDIRSWVGRLSLLETLALIRRCDLFIANDTGLAKTAMALGVPTATLWGPTDRREYGAVWDAERHLELSRGISCSPCSRSGMPYPRAGIDYRNCGHHDCLRLMEEDWVFDALRRKYPDILG